MIINDHNDWLEINLVAYKKNIDKMKAITGKPVMPIIKVYAYDHGLTEITRAALQDGTVVCGLTDRLPRIYKDE